MIGAMVGLGLDFCLAANEFFSYHLSNTVAHGLVDRLDQTLVIDVLSVFVLMELFRTFADYLEFRRVRLHILAEVGIAFVLREVFIGLYEHSLKSPEVFAMSTLLAVLVAARVAATIYHPRQSQD